jgi:DNA polymerase I
LTSASSEKIVIIDGNSLLYRAFYALPLLQNRRGEHTNAVYGFTNMLLRLLDEEKPDYVAVAFDPPKPSFRVKIDQSYKAQREKTPDELAEQIQRTIQILEALNIPVFEIESYEADDVIGTLADLFAGKEKAVTVVSGDADLLQLVSDRITVMLTKKGISQMERYNPDLLKEQYGLDPEQVIDFKALKGDPSDNIPGVPGIGDKTARNLIETYGSIEAIYENLGELKGKIAQNLEEYREQLYTGRDLVTLRRDVPLDTAPDECRYREPDYQRLLEIFNELEFKSLAAKVRPDDQDSAALSETAVKAGQFDLVSDLEKFLKKLNHGSLISLLVSRQEGRPYWEQPISSVALAEEGGKKGYFLNPESFGAEQTGIWKLLAGLREKDISLVTHNSKQLYHLFFENKLKSPKIKFDTMLAAYLADPARGGYDLPTLLNLHLGLDLNLKDERKKKALDPEEQGMQLAEQARQLFPLYKNLFEQLDEQQLEELLFDLELPLAKVLARMEREGMSIDTDYLRDLSSEICRRLDGLEMEIYAQAGEEFNINSPQQLSRILFDKLKLPEIRKTKTGRSTDARVLEELALHHEIAALLINYRQLAKLEGTYLSGMIDLVDSKKSKLYTTLNQAATATGRLSSSDPNLQNIPIRMEEGRRIRRAFVTSEKGRILFAADYSQVELRILAHLSEDPILVEAFKTGQDIHRRTAAEVNGIALDEVTPLLRERAKAVNFGIIYGSSDFGLAQNLKIPRAEAKAYIDSYFERYSGVRSYMDEIIRQAYEQGYVTTMLGRRRYLPEIHSSNRNIRSFAERMALNTPIQGSAADIIKLAMLKIDRIIAEGGFKAAMLLQIHDELLFEIDETEIDFFAPMIKQEMEQAMTLSVPLQVDLKWGCNWEELKNFGTH